MKKNVLPILLAASLLMTVAVAPISVLADEVDSKIEQKSKKINEISEQQKDVESQIDEVQDQVYAINESASVLLMERTKLRETSERLQEDIEQLNSRIEKREEAIQTQARDVQVNGESTTYMDAILNAKSVSDAITRMQAMNTIVKANNDLVKQQQKDKNEVEVKQAENGKKLAKLQENEVKLEAQKGELVRAEADLNVLQTTLAAEKATAEDEKERLLKEKEAAIAEREQIAEQERKIAENIQKEAEKEETPTSSEVVADAPASTEVVVDTPVVVVPEPEPENVEAPPVVEEITVPAPTGGSAVSVAAAQVGKPYVWGAKGPNSFDCSGLVYYSYMQATGRNVGGYTVAQESAGVRISVGEAQAGDLYFWGSPGSTYHVAIATGGGGYIHAGSPSTGVEYSSVSAFTPSFAVRM